MRTLLPCLLAFVLSLVSCKKASFVLADNPYGLPNATQEGKNIFACRVNGENWIAEKGFRTIGGGFTKEKMFVYGIIENNIREEFTINIHSTIKNGYVYELDDTLSQYVYYTSIGNNLCFDSTYGYGTLNVKAYEGELRLTKVDTVNGILSGTFRFNILTDYCDTMKVTDGRFDIRYY